MMSAAAAEPRLITDAAAPAAGSVATARVRTTMVLYGFTGLYAVIFTAAAAINYRLYLAPRLDLGNMVQVVWATAHGHFLQTSDLGGAEMSRLGAHFDPFLALLVPLWWAWSNPIVLLAAQAIAVASGALPVYWLGRKHLDNNGLALVFAIAYLLYSPTQFNAFTPVGIHAVSFAIPLLLYATWFLDNDRLILFTAFAVLAATTKEEIALAAGGLGIWYAIRRNGGKTGYAIFGVGLGWTLINMLVVIPHYTPTGQLPFAGRYAEVGSTPSGMLRVAVTDPSAFLHTVATWHKLGFLALIFLPLLGLWMLEPLMLLGAIPDLAINLLSDKPEQTTVFYQYTAGIIPFVVAASVLGAARVRRRKWVGPALIGATCCLALLSPMVWTLSHLGPTSHPQISTTRRALSLIPPNVSVSASQTLGAYVSTRRRVAVFPAIERADWVIVGHLAKSDDRAAFDAALNRLKASEAWKTVYARRDLTVFERARSAH
jgi:uncharacterized membrane protein